MLIVIEFFVVHLQTECWKILFIVKDLFVIHLSSLINNIILKKLSVQVEFLEA